MYFEKFLPLLMNKANINFVFINLIRDPVEHAISQWYFKQSGSKTTKLDKIKETGSKK